MSHAGSALIDPAAIFEKIGLKAGMHIADLGCGRTGHFIFPAAKKVGDTGIVYAVEIVKNILQSIESRIKSEGFINVHTIWSDIELYGKTPIPEGSLDVCFLINVLYLVKDKAAVLKEAYRLLHQDGLAVVIDWRKNLGTLGPGPNLMLGQPLLKQVSSDAGLSLVETFPAGEYHFCSILKK